LTNRNAFSFHKLLNIHFFEHFLQISHNLRIFNYQNNVWGQKTKKLTLAQLFHAMRSRPVGWHDYRTTHSTYVRTPHRTKKRANEL